jgi:hypothetical protein
MGTTSTASLSSPASILAAWRLYPSLYYNTIIISVTLSGSVSSVGSLERKAYAPRPGEQGSTGSGSESLKSCAEPEDARPERRAAVGSELHVHNDPWRTLVSRRSSYHLLKSQTSYVAV